MRSRLPALAHAAFEHIARAELAPDLPDVDRLALVDEARIAGDDGQRFDARQAGDDVLDHAVDEIVLLRIAAHVLERQRGDRRLFGARASPRAAAGLAASRRADLQRIGADRLGDVLQLRLAEIGDREFEPRLHLPVGVLGQTDRARRANAFEPRGDIDAVAHQIAVALLDNVAEVDADAEHDAPVGGHAGVALDHGVLHFDRAAHRVDHAAELDDRAVAGALDHPAVMDGDGRVDEVAAQRSQPRKRSVLVGAGEAAEADDVGRRGSRRVCGFRSS